MISHIVFHMISAMIFPIIRSYTCQCTTVYFGPGNTESVVTSLLLYIVSLSRPVDSVQCTPCKICLTRKVTVAEEKHFSFPARRFKSLTMKTIQLGLPLTAMAIGHLEVSLLLPPLKPDQAVTLPCSGARGWQSNFFYAFKLAGVPNSVITRSASGGFLHR